MPKLEPLVANRVTYYSENDELAFFEWLNRLECVGDYHGVGVDLFIELMRTPTDDDLRELLALFYRYRINLRQLARFDSGRPWFRDPKMYWHRGVFGPAAAKR